MDQDAKDPATPGEDKDVRPPIPPERRVQIFCPVCGWNAWAGVPTEVRELHYDATEKSGEVRATPFNLIACSGCGMRLFLNRNPDGTLVPSFDMPRNPLYRDALSGRGPVGP